MEGLTLVGAMGESFRPNSSYTNNEVIESPNTECLQALKAQRAVLFPLSRLE